MLKLEEWTTKDTVLAGCGALLMLAAIAGVVFVWFIHNWYLEG